MVHHDLLPFWSTTKFPEEPIYVDARSAPGFRETTTILGSVVLVSDNALHQLFSLALMHVPENCVR